VEKNLTYDQLAAAADSAKKDLHMVSSHSIYMCNFLNAVCLLNLFFSFDSVYM